MKTVLCSYSLAAIAIASVSTGAKLVLPPLHAPKTSPLRERTFCDYKTVLHLLLNVRTEIRSFSPRLVDFSRNYAKYFVH